MQLQSRLSPRAARKFADHLGEGRVSLQKGTNAAAMYASVMLASGESASLKNQAQYSLCRGQPTRAPLRNDKSKLLDVAANHFPCGCTADAVGKQGWSVGGGDVGLFARSCRQQQTCCAEHVAKVRMTMAQRILPSAVLRRPASAIRQSWIKILLGWRPHRPRRQCARAPMQCRSWHVPRKTPRAQMRTAYAVRHSPTRR